MATRPADPTDDVKVTPKEDLENISVDSSQLPRGASKGPLSKLIPVFIDVETFMSEDVSLDGMTLRQYLAATHLTAIAVAVGIVDPVQVFYTEKNPGPPGAAMVNEDLKKVLQYLALNPEYVFVAHNAAFDMRVLRFLLGVPHPINVWCSMEGAMGAWPECPGGFGLSNLAKRLRLPENRRKLEIDLKRLQKLMDKCPLAAAKADEMVVSQMKAILKIGGIPWPADDVITKDLCNIVLAIYNQRDVEAMREVFLMQAARISPEDQRVALRTHHQRRHHFMVDSEKLSEFVEKMDQNAAYAEKEVEAMVGTGDLRAVFNRENDNGILTSIRYARLKKLVNEKLASEQFESTSLKKLSPLQLARNPKVFELLTQTTRAGKMMSHKRRAKVFAGISEVDTELGYCLLEGTPVLTQRGWVAIEALQDFDMLWDGVEWVRHDGVIDNGVRECILVGGIWMTPDHKVLTDEGMTPACQLHEPTYRLSARLGETGLRLELPIGSTEKLESGWSLSNASVVSETACSSKISSAPGFRVAGVAGQIPATTVLMQTSSRMTSCGDTGVTGGSALSNAALTRELPSTTAMVGEGSVTAGKTSVNSSLGSRLLTAGTESSKPGPPSTGKTMTATTNRATSGSQTSEPTNRTSADQSSSILRSALVQGDTLRTSSDSLHTVPPSLSGSWPDAPLRTFLPETNTRGYRDVIQGNVYDVRNAGPRFRFQVGGLIVSNCRAHTGRFSSPSVGRGLNLHNVPKHDKAIAEPVRKLFRVPPGFCLVRGDLANVEFRLEVYLTGATNGIKMFDPLKGGNIFTDPYSASWKTMTGASITKKDPTRQVAKASVLGLGYVMAPPGFAKVLLTVLADKKSGVTEAVLNDIIIKNQWHMPTGDRVKKIMLMLGCSQTVAVSSYYIHKLFNEAYPEFRRTAYWLVKVIEVVAASGTDRDQARRQIDEMYKTTDAPNRDLIGLEIDDDPLTLYPSVRACCGHWPRTVCWREPHMRKTDFAGADDQKKLTIRKATGEFKMFTPQLAIENITQAAARNALCMGVENLDNLGFRDIIHVHDEIMILCKRERNAVLAARDALITCFGPKHTMPYAWSMLVKPDEITLTESLYEDENDVAVTIKNKEGLEVPGPDRWGRIERNEPGCLLNLP